ncbi:MAG: exosortase/archaeosortase family protein [Candidatus Aenigmarchaeota archaeon]|nr:exosortase/archaeosortase family protein [Candidatus Aenigmarchaeota archaeon]
MTSNFSSTIVFDCIGWKQFYIFCAMIFLPIGIDLSYRLKGLLILIPLYIYNLFRVVATISLMEFLSYSYFELIHYLLWDFLFLVLIFLPWYWWHLSYNGNIKTGKKILKKKIKPQTGKKNVKKKNVKRKVKLQNRKKVLNKKNTKKKIGLKTGKKVVKKNSK